MLVLSHTLWSLLTAIIKANMLSCKYRINHICVIVVALANVSPAFCGIFYGGYQQQSAPLTLNPGPSPPSPSAPSAAPATVTTTYSSPSAIPISYTPHATSSSFRHQISHSVPATTTTQGVATAYVAVSPASSYGNSYTNNAGFSSSQGASSPSSSAGGYASSAYSFTAADAGNSSPSSQSGGGSNGAQQGLSYGNGYGFGGYAGYGGGNNGAGGSSGLSG